MTHAEAIAAIKANWPTENYTMLREALTLACAALASPPAEDENRAKLAEVIRDVAQRESCGVMGRDLHLRTCSGDEDTPCNCGADDPAEVLRGVADALIWPTAAQAPPASDPPGAPFDLRVAEWLKACFGTGVAGDVTERNHRFLEEALELVQTGGCTASEAHQLVDYVYGRPVGVPSQEAGGVLLTLAALCMARAIDMQQAGEDELRRVWTKIDLIRRKQAEKPKHSPLPASPQAETKGDK